MVFVLAAFGKGGNESRGSATGVMSPLVRVPLSSGTGAVGLLWLEEFGGSSIKKIQGEGLKGTKAFLLSQDKLAWCFGPALEHCLLPARFLFPPWNWLW